MTSGRFDVESWVERLARALEGLATVQEDFWDELYGKHPQGLHRDNSRDPSETFRHFYWRASYGKSRVYEERYGSVRSALTEIRGILLVHPAWAGLVAASRDGEIWFQLPAGGGMTNPSETIGGLMARAKEAGQDGFRLASSELSLLLQPEGEMYRDPRSDKLLTGYHVVLFQGLMVAEEFGIGDDMMIVPFANLTAYFDAPMLERLAPDATRYRGGSAIAAIVKPFRWKPEFRKDGESSRSDGLGAGTFFEDAEIIIELLALFHAAPVVRLASVARRVHGRACLLLGSMDVHHSYSAGRPSWSLGTQRRPVEARRDAIDEAARAFAGRHGERYRNCAPVISRLAEALARQGRFRTDDRVLDVAIALERMYGLDQGEISFKLKTRAACFLETQTQSRQRVFNDVKELYDARSGIVHAGSKRKKKPREVLERERQAAFDKGFDVARRSVVKLLNEGPPRDWNEVILDVDGTRERSGGTATTVPGYTNRNGQTVVRRTDTPGNDHNQVVYELECGGCGHRYGANGSDIWQRRCPKCGGGRPG